MPAQIEQARGWYILMQQDPSETFEPLLALMGKLGAFWVGAVVGAALAGWLQLGCKSGTKALCLAATAGAGWLPFAQIVLVRACAAWL